MATYVGVDYHKAFSYLAILDEAGAVLKEGRVANDAEAVQRFLGEYRGDACSAVLEATRNWCVMHDWLEAVCGRVALAHPLKVRAIAEARIKTDRIDATTLAHLLRCDLVPEAHVASPSARMLKSLLRHRMFLVKLQTMIKNRIHALLDRHPNQRRERVVKELFIQAGMTWLKGLALPEHERAVLDNELTLLEALRQRLKQADVVLKRTAANDERVQRLTTIPGIGRFFAMLILSEIDDVHRFASPKKFHAYAGLVPSTYASGGRCFHKRITKQGNPYLRWAMIEAVWPALRKDHALHTYYQRLARHKGANKAKVAATRRLLTVVYRLLKDNRCWREAA